MPFKVSQKVLFRHCDPAGIVFFPRYFEMMNDCVEAFFDEVIGVPFHAIHATTAAVPTVQISTEFTAPSRHGDSLMLELSIIKVGRTSFSYRITARCEGELRFDTTATLVYVGSDGRPAPLPDTIRYPLKAHKETSP